MNQSTIPVTVPISYAVLVQLIKKAEAEETTIESLIATVLEDHVEAPDMMSTHAAMELALERAEAQEPGAEFLLEDLFREEEWRRVPGTRGLGRRFRTAVEAADAAIAKHVRKTITNKAVYKRL
jgi:hypothetical protein